MRYGRPLILLVEDDQDTAALYQALLDPEEVDVVLCSSGSLARQWVQEADRSPDLLVLDVRLPDGSGLDLCRELVNKRGECAAPPVIVLSAHGDPRMPELCQEAGAQVFLDKLKDLHRFPEVARRLVALQGK